MLEVKVRRTTTRPDYQRHEGVVQLFGFDRLTPRAARAALEIAFGQPYGGEVRTVGEADEDSFGYRVYKNSARKVYPWS